MPSVGRLRPTVSGKPTTYTPTSRIRHDERPTWRTFWAVAAAGNVDGVLGGDIGPFVIGYRTWLAAQ